MRPELRHAAILPSAMETLARTTSLLALASNQHDLVVAVVDAASRLLSADAVHLGTLDRRRGVLRLVVNAGTLAEWEMTLSEGERGLFVDYPQLVNGEQPGVVWHVGLDDTYISDYNRSLLLALGASHAMSVPVFVGGEVWGELFFSRNDSFAFSGDEEDAAVVLSGLLGAGLARLDGAEQLVDLAYTDSLTGLANRRLADERLQAWAADPQSCDLIAVALCDANELKSVNDKLGHLTGDRLLSELALLVQAAAHRLPQAFAARIGGDEFLIAGLCESDTLLNEVAADLTVSSHTLPLGSGLSCGTAWSGNLARMEARAADHVSALLRLADVSQYEQKRSRRSATALTTPRQGPQDQDLSADGSDEQGEAGGSSFPAPTTEVLAGEITLLLQRARSVPPRDSLLRLADVAATLCSSTGAAAWWISSIDRETGTVVARSCGTPRADGHSDGQWPAVVVDPTPYRIADYPATAAIVRGGSFGVDTISGDPAERHLLVQTGFASMIAAAATDSSGATWLVELYGDALTKRLRRHGPLLEALVFATLA